MEFWIRMSVLGRRPGREIPVIEPSRYGRASLQVNVLWESGDCVVRDFSGCYSNSYIIYREVLYANYYIRKPDGEIPVVQAHECASPSETV